MSIRSFFTSLDVGPAWGHHNLTVHPLISNGSGNPFYLTLDEALATGRFRVAEISECGSVPELKACNGLSQPVLLLDGEELIGAKQNRVLNLTIMVPANTEIAIPVSCVEAGRWQQVSDSFLAADRTQFARGRAKKLAQVSHSLRVSSSRRSDQSDIWSEIDAKSIRMSAGSPTAAMSAIFEHSRAKLDDFIGAAQRCDRQVGAAFSISGEIAGIDAFDSADTFAKVAPKLIRSYAVDAMERTTATPRVGPAPDAVRAFLTDVAGVSANRFKALGLGDDLRLNGMTLAGAALETSGQIVHVVAFPAAAYEDHNGIGFRYRRTVRARTSH